jgi:hypothetical protein
MEVFLFWLRRRSESQAAEVGLTHGNIHDDSYKQEVPLMRVTPMAISNVHIALGMSRVTRQGTNGGRCSSPSLSLLLYR